MTTFDWIGVFSLVACVALVAFAAGSHYGRGRPYRARPFPPGHPEDWTPEEAREHYPRFREQ